MQRRIVVSQYMSLDGVVEDPVGMESSGLGNWTGPFNRGPEGDQFKLDEVNAIGAVLLGRVTYDAFAAVWPHIKDEGGVAACLNSLPKFVVSNSLRRADWVGTEILAGDAAERVRDLKAQPGGDLLVYGSIALVHSLMNHDLIDEYNLMIYPTVLGRGRKLFAQGYASTLMLQECRTLGGGIVLARYRTP